MENTLTIDRRGPTNVGDGVIRRVGRNDRYSKVIIYQKCDTDCSLQHITSFSFSLCPFFFSSLSPHPPYSLSSVGYVGNRLGFQKISLTKCLWKWFDSVGILTKLYALLTIHYSSFKVLQKQNFNSLNLHLTPTNDHTLDFVISSVQSLSHVWLFVTPWTAAHQASLFITNSRRLLKLMSIESVILS